MGGLLLPSLINSQTFNLLFIIELMTIQDLLEEAYEDTNTSIANYPYTKGLKKLNEIYSEMYRMIVTTQEDYFWTYWTTDLQEWAREERMDYFTRWKWESSIRWSMKWNQSTMNRESKESNNLDWWRE